MDKVHIYKTNGQESDNPIIDSALDELTSDEGEVYLHGTFYIDRAIILPANRSLIGCDAILIPLKDMGIAMIETPTVPN